MGTYIRLHFRRILFLFSARIGHLFR